MNLWLKQGPFADDIYKLLDEWPASVAYLASSTRVKNAFDDENLDVVAVHLWKDNNIDNELIRSFWSSYRKVLVILNHVSSPKRETDDERISKGQTFSEFFV